MSTIYLDLDQALMDSINNNGLNLDIIFTQANLDIKTSYGLIPGSLDSGGNRSKDLVPIILASGASLSAIILALSHAFRGITRRPRIIELATLDEIRDAKGNVLLDSNGVPVFKRTTTYQILEPQSADSLTEMEGKVGPAILRFKTSETQNDTSTEK